MYTTNKQICRQTRDKQIGNHDKCIHYQLNKQVMYTKVLTVTKGKEI